MFRLTDAKPVERILILRDYQSAKVPLEKIANELHRLQVRVFEYHIHHKKRRPPYETFHAKIILGDDSQAYVGSANMLASSLDLALEVGLLVKGQSVVDIKRLVDSMISISNSMSNL
jgi:phosphatidylserine/phosphatidylglycerophosphate/cardiolipin synthase-like enzyme